MRLTANAETIDRLVDQGCLILRAFHTKHKKDPAGSGAEFLRGEFAGWRNTLHTEYHDGAEEIVDRVLIETGLAIPEGGMRGGATHASDGGCRIERSRFRN